MTKIHPAPVTKEWLSNFLQESLFAAQGYQIDVADVPVKLDQNESPWDWPERLKDAVWSALKSRAWNRYPQAFCEELHHNLADYVGVQRSSIFTTPGSNLLITLVLGAFSAKRKGKIVVARPSFQLYESYLSSRGIPYEPWPLSDKFQYQEALLDQLPEHSLVVFASPNNPVGNHLSFEKFERKLKANPTSMFIADEAYFEFVDRPYTELFTRYNNFLSVRTFSKLLGSAGVRLGYCIGSDLAIQQLQKLRLPYLLNHFTIAATNILLKDPELKRHIKIAVDKILSERQRVLAGLIRLASADGFEVIPSSSNFLLYRFLDNGRAAFTYQNLIKLGVLVRNVSGGPGLEGCLRVTVGTEVENNAFLAAMTRIVG